MVHGVLSSEGSGCLDQWSVNNAVQRDCVARKHEPGRRRDLKSADHSTRDHSPLGILICFCIFSQEVFIKITFTKWIDS